MAQHVRNAEFLPVDDTHQVGIDDGLHHALAHRGDVEVDDTAAHFGYQAIAFDRAADSFEIELDKRIAALKRVKILLSGDFALHFLPDGYSNASRALFFGAFDIWIESAGLRSARSDAQQGE